MAARRKRRRYSDIPAGNSAGLEGMHIFKPNSNASVVFRDWNSKVPSIFRIVPSIDDFTSDKPKFEEYRDDEGFTNWFARLPTVQRIGTSKTKLTFNLYDPFEPPDDIYSLPYCKFYNRMKEAANRTSSFKAGGKRVSPNDFKVLFGSNVDRDDRVLDKPGRMTTYVQVLTYFRKDKDVRNGRIPLGAGEGDQPNYLMLKSSAAKALERALSKEKESVPEEYTDWDEVFYYGDVTQLGPRGKFLIVYNPENHNIDSLKNLKRSVIDEDDIVDEEDAVNSDGGGGAFKGDEIEFLEKPIIPKQSGSGGIQLTGKLLEDKTIQRNILRNYTGMDDHWLFPTDDQMALYVAQAFSDEEHRYLVEYAFEDTPFFTDDVRAIVRSRTQHASAGNIQDEDDEDIELEVEDDELDVEDDELDVDVDDEDYKSEEEDPAPQKKEKRTKNTDVYPELEDDSDDLEAEIDELLASEESDLDDDVEDDDVEDDDGDDVYVDDDDDEEPEPEPEPEPKPKRRKSTKTARGAKSRKSADQESKPVAKKSSKRRRSSRK